MFDWNEQVQLLQRRVAQVTEWHPELEIPNLSTPYLMEHAQDWLPFYLEEGNHVISTNSGWKINLKKFIGIAFLMIFNRKSIGWLYPYPSSLVAESNSITAKRY